MSEHFCWSHEGCKGTGVLGDLSSRLVYCDCAIGRAVRDRDVSNLRGSIEPAEGIDLDRDDYEALRDRFEARLTRADGSAR